MIAVNPLATSPSTRPPSAAPGAPAPATRGDDAGPARSAHAPAADRGGAAAAPDQRVNALGNSPEAAQLRELRARDREVRSHERAHAAAAAGLPHSAPSYTYQRGPDGRMYAIGGEVRIDTAPVAGDPRATIDKAEQIRRAALAPAQPSAQDRAVAARAAAMAAQARAELQSERAEEAAAEREAAQSNDSEEPTAAGETHTSCPVCGAKHHGSTHIAGSYGEVAAKEPARAPVDLST